MMKRFLFLAQDDRGTATIELAIVSPMLVALVVGLVDISTAFSNKLRLEQVAQRTIEKIQQAGFETSDETTLETEAETAAGSGADADLTYWLECNGVKQTGAGAYDNGCGNGQVMGRYVQVDIARTYTPLIVSPLAGSSSAGNFTLNGTSGIRIQ